MSATSKTPLASRHTRDANQQRGLSTSLLKAMKTTTRPISRNFTAYTSQPHVDAQRKRELGHIHQGKSALGWTDDDYRFHLRNLTGKSSSAELDAGGRREVLAHMAKFGFTPKASAFKPFDQAAKIKWLWKKLAEAGGLRHATPAALLVFVGSTTGTGVSDVKFLPTLEASKVIEALKAMLDRAKRARSAPTCEQKTVAASDTARVKALEEKVTRTPTSQPAPPLPPASMRL